VFFRFVEAWTHAYRDEEYEGGRTLRLVFLFNLAFFLVVGVGALLLARRNLKLGRGDRAGAYKLAVFTFTALMAQWVIAGTHVTSLFPEFGLFIHNLAFAVLAGGITWLIYIALEPFVRRRWPDTIVSWTRLLVGRVRDPRVGRDMLVGAATFGGLLLLVDLPQSLIARWTGVPPPGLTLIPENLDFLLGGRYLASFLIGSVLTAFLGGMGVLFLLLLLRIVLRKDWLAIAAIILIMSLPIFAIADRRLLLVSLVFSVLSWVVLLLVLSRFGLVGFGTILLLTSMMRLIPSTDLSTWYAGTTIAVIAAMMAVAGYGFVTSLAGRPLFREGLVPEE
jgi:serine/threonine-protein kinase